MGVQMVHAQTATNASFCRYICQNTLVYFIDNTGMDNLFVHQLLGL